MMYDQSGRFIIEMLASPTERAFLNTLWKNPDDTAARNAYHDFLIEQGRDTAATHLRDGMLPGFGRLHKWETVSNGRTVCVACRAWKDRHGEGGYPCYGAEVSSGMLASGSIQTYSAMNAGTQVRGPFIVYADWLEEHGKTDSAKLVREKRTP